MASSFLRSWTPTPNTSRLTDAAGQEDRAYGPLGEVVKTTRTVPARPARMDGSGNLTMEPAPSTYVTQYRYDTWNRLKRLTYPDGEVLTYGYDAGGNVTSATGVKGPYAYAYLNRLTYDKFETRAVLSAGNGVVTRYTYDPRTRRLANLNAAPAAGGAYQNLNYGYDPVGNVLFSRSHQSCRIRTMRRLFLQSRL